MFFAPNLAIVVICKTIAIKPLCKLKPLLGQKRVDYFYAYLVV